MREKQSLPSKLSLGLGRGGYQATLCDESHTRSQEPRVRAKRRGAGTLTQLKGKEWGGREHVLELTVMGLSPEGCLLGEGWGRMMGGVFM